MAEETVTCANCEASNPATRKACRRCRRVLRRATPEQRRAAAILANNDRWSRVKSGTLATAPARAAGPANLDYWLKRVDDPDREMSHADRIRAAENAKAAYYRRLGKAGSSAKRINRATATT